MKQSEMGNTNGPLYVRVLCPKFNQPQTENIWRKNSIFTEYVRLFFPLSLFPKKYAIPGISIAFKLH
jgi:hypothetical protein